MQSFYFVAYMAAIGILLFVVSAIFGSPIKNKLFLKCCHSERAYLDRTIPDVRPSYKQILIPPLCDNPTELVWGASFALVIYQMGIAHAICRENDNQTLLKKLRISGISGGSATAGYMMSTLYGIGDMKYWYFHHVRSISLESSTTWSMRNWATTIWNHGYEYYRICHILGMTEADWKCRYRIITANASGFALKILDTFPNAASFGDGIVSSSFIPFVISPYLGFIQQDASSGEKNVLIDGGFGFDFTTYDPPNDVVHFSLQHSQTVDRTTSKYGRVHYSILDNIDTLRDNWGIFKNPEYADQMFDKGYEFGIRNMDEIKKMLNL